MFRYGTILPTFALASLMVVGLATEGRAQTANDVVCNKCVDKRDLAKNAVARNKIKRNAVTGAKVKDGSIELKDLSPALRQMIANLQVLADLAAFITVDEVETDLNGDGVIDPSTERLPRILIEGANVQIINGDPSESTNSRNGLGNLIVGYNEPRIGNIRVCSDGQFIDNDPGTGCEANGHIWAFNHKSGSHNLIVGPENAYSRTGGTVLGASNAINREGASVTGGFRNLASGSHSSVSGGDENFARGDRSSATGGNENIASGPRSTVGGGINSFTDVTGEWVAGGLSSNP